MTRHHRLCKRVLAIYQRVHDEFEVGELVSPYHLRLKIRKSFKDPYIKFLVRHQVADHEEPIISGYTEFNGAFVIGIIVHSKGEFVITNDFLVCLVGIVGHELRHVMQKRSRPKRIEFRQEDDERKYLMIKDEIDAFAFEIALDMVLRSKTVSESSHHYLGEYRKLGGNSYHRLLRKITRYEYDIFERAMKKR